MFLTTFLMKKRRTLILVSIICLRMMKGVGEKRVMTTRTYGNHSQSHQYFRAIASVQAKAKKAAPSKKTREYMINHGKTAKEMLVVMLLSLERVEAKLKKLDKQVTSFRNDLPKTIHSTMSQVLSAVNNPEVSNWWQVRLCV